MQEEHARLTVAGPSWSKLLRHPPSRSRMAAGDRLLRRSALDLLLDEQALGSTLRPRAGFPPKAAHHLTRVGRGGTIRAQPIRDEARVDFPFDG